MRRSDHILEMSRSVRVLPYAIIGITAGALLVLVLARAPAASPELVVATTLLQSSLDNVAAITSPAAGLGGTTSLPPTDFVTVDGRTGARLIGEGQGKYISFPAATGSVQNIELDQGEIEFWYRPNYDAGADDDATHTLLVVGDVYNEHAVSGGGNLLITSRAEGAPSTGSRFIVCAVGVVNADTGCPDVAGIGNLDSREIHEIVVLVILVIVNPGLCP